ncbi:MAG: sulfotransferase, partial [Nocardioidaceae bacterium]
YDDFVADPVGTVRDIYRAFDLPWTSEVSERVTAIDAGSRQGGRRPSHRYSLADYGLTDEQVLSRF